MGLNSEELEALMMEEANDDYFRFKQCIDYAIGLMDANDG
jgi:hypothetical protein